MENTSDFLELKELSEISSKYNSQTNIENNIFDILFHGREERELHSRFISYLLSSKQEFLELFVRETLKINELGVGNNKIDIENFEVYPNRHDKREKWDIDILIINREKGQAIIIENKIDAEDSNICGPVEYNGKSYAGQLERYYHTITTGYYKDGNYFCEFKEEDKSFVCRDKVSVFYLSLYKKPSPETYKTLDKSVFDPKESVKSYRDIQEWIKRCIKWVDNSQDKAGEYKFLRAVMEQYLNFLSKIINDDEIARALTDLISKDNNWEKAIYSIGKLLNNELDENLNTIKALEFLGDKKKEYKVERKPVNEKWKNASCLQENFIHIKWHTIHRFFTKLGEKLEKKINTSEKTIIIQMPDDNSITEVAQGKKQTKLIIKFEHNGTKLQIVNDNKGFTLGNRSKMTWEHFSEESKNDVALKDIKFCDFSNKETFQMISAGYQEEIIDQMINSIVINNIYEKIRQTF